ncbi:ABC transporter permease [Sporosarcina pasteurii]|uniref:Glutathione transport system permease protein gsiC n=2 Tax=Sporosarcina pasteurii TaxID=1474 RepID=A0A380CAY9_SPOPA|nr:ABC transporter permease [Sporosarcina pasteurii]MDS9472728.1 ABC transporter permease [Sporosarcina pasteurii]SUJ15458.1 Glutathione transport system permease protein gsiC [Sporosarcina pasteurii]
MMKKLVRFLLFKTIRIATLLVAICLISFLLVKNSPIDPIQAYIGADMLKVGPEQREKIAEYWGLNEPTFVQFLNWGSAVLKGDLGTSMIYRSPVSDVIGERFLNSVVLMITAWIFSGIVGFILGVVAAMKRNTWIDRIIQWYCYTLASTPTFWVGLLMLIVFAVWLGWFPIGLGVPVGVLAEDVTLTDRLQHLLLPAITLSILGVANVALHTRQKLIDVLASDYVLFAKARGERGFTLFWRHGLRNVALPAITLQFAAFSELFGGAVLAEQVFSYPGLGQATVEAGLRGDVPLLLGLVIFSTLFVFIGNLIADLIYQIVDPRTREGRM